MTLTTRIIPCLDIDKGRVVKGVNFVNIIDAGDPVLVAEKYAQEGADEITFLDITATSDKRATLIDLVRKVAKNVFIPLSVGGGVRTLEDIELLLNSGADKVCINSHALSNPELIKRASAKYGEQCIIVAIDAKKNSNSEKDSKSWQVYTHGGRKPTGIDALSWAKKMAEFGAGELLITSMDRDGTKQGFDNELNAKIAEIVNIPIIASGGVGTLEDLVDGVKIGKADAVLAASIFHFGEYSILEAKQTMQKASLTVRI